MGAGEDHAKEVVVLAKVCLVSSPYKEKTKHSKFKKNKLHIGIHIFLMTKYGFTVPN